MVKLVFATNNMHKVEEVSKLILPSITLYNLKDINCFDELPETQETLEGNALQKAKFIFDKYNLNCFADDTGLEVEALHGRPGVYSARYAGSTSQNQNEKAEANMQKLLQDLQGIKNRNACFKTIIALIMDTEVTLFEGKVNGTILTEKSGAEGFGYDPIFLPNGYTKTFAQMTIEEKGKISHRAIAVNKLVEFLSTKYST